MELDQYTKGQRDRLQYLDAGNVIGTMMKYLERELKVSVPYLSWIIDSYENPDGKMSTNEIINDFYDKLCRVYGYRLTEKEEEKMVKLDMLGKYSWQSIEGILASSHSVLQYEKQRQWVHMWINSCDANGEHVHNGLGWSRT